jgi:hypothetical protein
VTAFLRWLASRLGMSYRPREDFGPTEPSAFDHGQALASWGIDDDPLRQPPTSAEIERCRAIVAGRSPCDLPRVR